MSDETDREQGRKEGYRDAVIEDHTRHLGVINGSIERSALALEAVAKEVRGLSVKFDMQIKMAEAARVALADETERRRVALADNTESVDRRFSKRERLAALAVTILFGLIGVYIATH
jgi:hypothetical protein